MSSFNHINSAILIQDNLLKDQSNYQNLVRKSKVFYDQLYQAFPTLDYRDYQYEYAALYAIRRNNICAGSCGIGKTFISGLLIATLYSSCFSRPGQIQIAAPNRLSASSRWLVDLDRIPVLHNLVEFIGHPSQLDTSQKPIWIYTHDFLKRKTKDSNTKNCVLHKLKRMHATPSLLIIDECHLLKPGSNRSDFWQIWRSQSKRTLLISGTLSDGRLDLIYHLLSFTYKNYFPISRSKFYSDFSVNKKITSNYISGTDEDVIPTTTRYLEQLSITKVPDYFQLVKTFIHRISLNDPNVAPCITLPSNTTHVETITPTEEHTLAYKDFVYSNHGSYLRYLSDQSSNFNRALSLINPLISLSNFPSFKNNKLDRLLQLVSSHPGKTVIFCTQVQTSRLIYQSLCNTLGAEHCLRLYANDLLAAPKTLSMSARENLLTQFMFNSEISVGVFSINLASESIDLNTASQVIFYDLPWQSLKIQQAIFRAVRPGSICSHVDIYYLINQGMIDQHQYALLAEKLSASKIMLDFDPSDLHDSSTLNPKMVLQSALSFLSF